MGNFVASQYGGGPKRLSSLKSVTHILQWWNLAVTPYLDKIQKIYESKFAISIICNSFNFSSIFKDFFNNNRYNFDDVSKNS